MKHMCFFQTLLHATSHAALHSFLETFWLPFSSTLAFQIVFKCWCDFCLLSFAFWLPLASHGLPLVAQKVPKLFPKRSAKGIPLPIATWSPFGLHFSNISEQFGFPLSYLLAPCGSHWMPICFLLGCPHCSNIAQILLNISQYCSILPNIDQYWSILININ